MAGQLQVGSHLRSFGGAQNLQLSLCADQSHALATAKNYATTGVKGRVILIIKKKKTKAKQNIWSTEWTPSSLSKYKASSMCLGTALLPRSSPNAIRHRNLLDLCIFVVLFPSDFLFRFLLLVISETTVVVPSPSFSWLHLNFTRIYGTSTSSPV